MEKTLKLVLPAPEQKEEILNYKKEFEENRESMDGTAGLAAAESFEVWYEALLDNRSEETVREGLVPATTYLGVEAQSGRIVGFIDIRHRLNEYLLQFGGHIGYSVRKSERGHGYAAQMLQLALETCRELGIKRVLITCNRGNLASEKTILKCGGVFENETVNGQEIFRRFWIDL